MLRAALELAEAGWAVLPLDGKKPVTPHGHHDATTDPVTIRRWWKFNPDYNIGSPVPYSLIVFDVDPRNGGSLDDLERVTGVKLPRTLEVISGRRDGGRHLYFKRPFKPYRGGIPHGIDVKVNGYMVMPPSLHPETGEPYQWVKREAARLPRQVAALMLPRTRVTRRNPNAADAVALAVWVRTLQPGERHDGLFWAASRLHEAGANQRGIGLLVDAAEDIGVNRREAARVIESARKEHA